MSESFVIRKLIWENINLELNNGCRERERERERERVIQSFTWFSYTEYQFIFKLLNIIVRIYQLYFWQTLNWKVWVRLQMYRHVIFLQHFLYEAVSLALLTLLHAARGSRGRNYLVGWCFWYLHESITLWWYYVHVTLFLSKIIFIDRENIADLAFFSSFLQILAK